MKLIKLTNNEMRTKNDFQWELVKIYLTNSSAADADAAREDAARAAYAAELIFVNWLIKLLNYRGPINETNQINK